MTGPSLLQAAVDELYGQPMTEFTARRKALAAAARKAGDRESAGLIAALRKPTSSADTLNKLVRAAPEEVGSLLQLGADLRAAERVLDAAELRDLSVRRRHLVGELSRLAFDITDQPNPSASARDEVTATLNAALADEQIAGLLKSGSLLTQARWDGFGSASLPDSAAALPVDDARRRPATSPRSGSADGESMRPDAAVPPDAGPSTARPAGSRTADVAARTADAAARAASADAARAAAAKAARAAAAEAAHAAERAAARSRIDLEQRRRVESARQDAADAERAAREAKEAVSVVDRRISELSVQMAHQRELLSQAQRALRDAETRRRSTQLALTRAGGAPAD